MELGALTKLQTEMYNLKNKLNLKKSYEEISQSTRCIRGLIADIETICINDPEYNKMLKSNKIDPYY